MGEISKIERREKGGMLACREVSVARFGRATTSVALPRIHQSQGDGGCAGKAINKKWSKRRSACRSNVGDGLPMNKGYIKTSHPLPDIRPMMAGVEWTARVPGFGDDRGRRTQRLRWPSNALSETCYRPVEKVAGAIGKLYLPRSGGVVACR